MIPRPQRYRNQALLVLCILLGLVSVPVECAAVWGPHSVFIPAQDVETLRDEANRALPEHHHDHLAAQDSVELPRAHLQASRSEGDADQEQVAPPAPTSVSLDAAVSLCLLQLVSRPLVVAPRGVAPSAFVVPGDRFLPAPEPPPPIRLW